MKKRTEIPNVIRYRWLCDKPQTLVVGAGPYAGSLAQILDGRLIKPEMLTPEHGLPEQFLQFVTRAVLVIEEDCSAPEAVGRCDQIYRCIQKRTKKGKFHRTSVLFVCSGHASPEFESSVADGVGLANLDPEKGASIWRQAEPLAMLLQRLVLLRTADWSEIQNRRRSRPQSRALLELQSAILSGPRTKIRKAVQAVSNAFEQNFRTLENYCNPPHHPNAGKWREWLGKAVTGQVTPKSWAEGRKLLPTLNIQ